MDGPSLDQHRLPLLKLIHKKLPKWSHARFGAEDVLQETYLRAWRKQGLFDGENLFGWLSTIAVRTAQNMVRDHQLPSRSIRREAARPEGEDWFGWEVPSRDLGPVFGAQVGEVRAAFGGELPVFDQPGLRGGLGGGNSPMKRLVAKTKKKILRFI